MRLKFWQPVIEDRAATIDAGRTFAALFQQQGASYAWQFSPAVLAVLWASTARGPFSNTAAGCQSNRRS